MQDVMPARNPVRLEQPEAALRVVTLVQGAKTMPVILPLILAASHIVLVANQIPEFNINSGCQIAAAAAISPHGDLNACKRDELIARKKLGAEWNQYTSAQKARCVMLTQLGGDPSYVELRTCLEMAKITKSLPPASRMASSNWSG